MLKRKISGNNLQIIFRAFLKPEYLQDFEGDLFLGLETVRATSRTRNYFISFFENVCRPVRSFGVFNDKLHV